MNALSSKIADILQITFEKAMALLPIIAEEFVKYKIINSIFMALIIVGVGMLLILISAFFTYSVNMEYVDRDRDTAFKMEQKVGLMSLKIFKKLIIPTLLVFVLTVVFKILPYIFCPTFMFVKDMFLK